MAKERTEQAPKPAHRPRLSDEPLSHVSTRLPTPYLDRICQMAIKQDTSVAAIVRQLLIMKLR